MKSASGALLALFASNAEFEQFDLYTFTLTSGYVLRYTNCPFNVVFGGHTWLCSTGAGGVVIDENGDSGPRANWTSDLNVGTWEVTVMPRLTDLIGSNQWASAVRAGILDEAIVRVDRGYVTAWPAPALSLVPVGILNVFYGRVAEIDFGRSVISINMNDPRELLAISMPRNLFGAGCQYALFDSECTLNPATYAVFSTIMVASSSQALQITLPAGTVPDNFFALGNIAFTSGLNNGLRMMVRQSNGTSGALALLSPMPFVASAGDTVVLHPGCDKTQASCVGTFGNLVNYGGFDYIPAAETAV